MVRGGRGEGHKERGTGGREGRRRGCRRVEGC